MAGVRATATAVPCDSAAVHVRLLRLFASPSYRPPVLPAVAIEILALSQRPSVGFDEVVAVLERDPILAGKVLSRAQSAAFAARSPVLSLRNATVRLGLKTLRDLVVEAAVELRVFRVPGYEAAMERLALHSTTTAYVVRAVCARTAIPGEYAFLCGLLHDVGIAAALLALSDDRRGGLVPFEALGTVLHDVHESASGLVTRLWGLPAELQRVVQSHHQLHVGGAPDPTIAALVVAEGLAEELGAGLGFPGLGPHPGGLDANPPELFGEACRVLGLDDAALAALREEAAALAAALATSGGGAAAAHDNPAASG